MSSMAFIVFAMWHLIRDDWCKVFTDLEVREESTTSVEKKTKSDSLLIPGGTITRENVCDSGIGDT
jgi:hypothetical protein